jgi:hypothetical protein
MSGFAVYFRKFRQIGSTSVSFAALSLEKWGEMIDLHNRSIACSVDPAWDPLWTSYLF